MLSYITSLYALTGNSGLKSKCNMEKYAKYPNYDNYYNFYLNPIRLIRSTKIRSLIILCICFNSLFASVLYISLQRTDIEMRQSYPLHHIQSMAKMLNAPSKPFSTPRQTRLSFIPTQLRFPNIHMPSPPPNVSGKRRTKIPPSKINEKKIVKHRQHKKLYITVSPSTSRIAKSYKKKKRRKDWSVGGFWRKRLRSGARALSICF